MARVGYFLPFINSAASFGRMELEFANLIQSKVLGAWRMAE